MSDNLECAIGTEDQRVPITEPEVPRSLAKIETVLDDPGSVIKCRCRRGEFPKLSRVRPTGYTFLAAFHNSRKFIFPLTFLYYLHFKPAANSL